jgi:ribosomal protein S18 acetylase RimI-like enzyme
MSSAPGAPYVLPASFEQDLIFVEPVTAGGRRLRFLADTGGGDWMYRTAALDLGLAEPSTGESDDWTPTLLPPFRDEAWMPSPLEDGSILLTPSTEDGSGPFPPIGGSGLLGQQWFSRRIWELDYRAGRLVLHQTLPTDDCPVTIPLGFLEADGQRTCNFPRIQAGVDGEEFDLLLDTGAHTHLTQQAELRTGRSGRRRATSFIIDSIAHRWREQHPDWPVIENGEAGIGADMIQVPSVHLGGLHTGPVWFTQRQDPNFLEYMSQWMDKPVVGALGGNALRAFRLLLDYPAARVSLRQNQVWPGVRMKVQVRVAKAADVDPIIAFGSAVVPPHYTPILGADTARAQLAWWTRERIASAVGAGRVHVAVAGDAIVGVSETGELAGEQVIWKLYLAPDFRGRSIGVELLRHAVAALPGKVDHVLVEHFAGNTRAGTFYERQGFTVVGSDPGGSGDPNAAVVWRRLELAG